MSIFINRDTRVIVQGITGRTSHKREMNLPSPDM